MVSIKARLHVLLERMRSYGIAALSVCVSLITANLRVRLFIDWPESRETAGVSIRRVIEKWNGIETYLRAAGATTFSCACGRSRGAGSEFKGRGETLEECITIQRAWTVFQLGDVSKMMVFRFKWDQSVLDKRWMSRVQMRVLVFALTARCLFFVSKSANLHDKVVMSVLTLHRMNDTPLLSAPR